MNNKDFDFKQNNQESGIVESYAKRQVETLMSRMQEKSKKESKRNKFYYSFLTLILLFCLVQIGFGVILNISKTISYRAKIATLEKIKARSEAYNIDLKQNITQFSTSSSLEGIARNNLKMAGEDEVLIIINDPKEQEKIEAEQLKLEAEQKKIREQNQKKQKKLLKRKQSKIKENAPLKEKEE
ncbi:hypothetical protein IJF81_01750 [bacterium]|nr:hypothetical protein [bacterium]